MNVKVALALVCLAVGTCLSGAVEWEGLSDENWYAGRKIAAEDLQGKVVLVDLWGYNCNPCCGLLPKMEEIWQNFKSKPFMLIGSHCMGRHPEEVGALVKKYHLTYPIYDHAGLVGAPESGVVPFLYVVDAQGKVVFKGVGSGAEREAIAAVVNALETAIDVTCLTGNVTPVKFKALARQLVLGRSCEGAVRQLKVAAKTRDARGREAEALVKAIEETQKRLKDRIAFERKTRPVAALADMTTYRQTWPTDGKAFDAEIRALTADGAVAKCAKVRAVLAKYRDFEPKTPTAAKRAFAEVQTAEAVAAALAAGASAAAGEAKAFAAELADLAADLTKAAAAKRSR